MESNKSVLRCRKCGIAAEEVPYYVKAATLAGVSLRRYLFYTDFVCPECAGDGKNDQQPDGSRGWVRHVWGDQS